jgi:hypothetical protein
MAAPRPQRSKKRPKKSKFISILEIFSTVEVQKANVSARLTRGSLTKTLDQELPLLTKKMFLQKLTLNILMSISRFQSIR